MLVLASCTYLWHAMYTNSLETTLNEPHDLVFKAISFTDQDTLVQMWTDQGRKLSYVCLLQSIYFLF